MLNVELEFAFEEYKDNPENFTDETPFKDEIKIKYCRYCGFPQSACTCTLECLI